MQLKVDDSRHLPVGWVIKKLGDVCNFQGGSQPPKSIFSTVCKENYVRLIQIRDYKSDNHIIFIPKDKARRFCTKEDVMIGRYGPPVFQILRGLEGAYNVALMKATPDESQLLKDFLFHFLKTPKVQNYVINLSARAAGQSGLNKATIEPYPIPLPPLPEQKRIVTILDEAFEKIDRAIANTEKNLTHSRELFENYLNAIFTYKGDRWKDAVIEDRIKFIDYRGRTPNKTEEGMRLITAKNVKMGFLRTEPQEFVDPNIYNDWMTRGIPTKGDVLFTTEAPLGNVAQLDTDEKVVFAQRVIIMQPDTEFINKTFLKFLLLSNIVQQRIQDKATGATAQGIKASLLKKIHISFPSDLLIQEAIVLKLETLEANTKRLEAIYRKKLAALKELKQSILQKAFTGELTTDTLKTAKEEIAA